MLKEKGWGALMKNILSLTAHNPTLAAIACEKSGGRAAPVQLCAHGNDACKCLSSQLLGCLRETEEEISFEQLREEANAFKAGPWLKTLKSMLKMPGSYEMTMTYHKDSVIALSIFPDGRIVSGSMDRTVRI